MIVGWVMQIEFFKDGGHHIVIVHCERGDSPPYKANGKVYIRRGSNNVEANEEEIAELYRRNSQVCDNRPVTNSTIEDLDLEFIKVTLEKRERSQIIGDDLIKLLCRMKILTNTNGESKPTIAGLLLFGKTPQDFLPNSRIRAEAKSDPDSTDWDDIAEFSGNIFEQIKDFESFVRRNIKVSAKVVGFERTEIPDIPIEAIREAVINAITHRDYSDSGSEIQLKIHGKKVMIQNPGGLIAPLTVETILSGDFIPKTRNPIIADLLVQLGYMDKRGTGLKRMIHLCGEAGLKEPEFGEFPDRFQVIFNGGDKSIVDGGEKIIIPDSILKNIKLDTEHKKILKVVEKEKEINSTKCQEILGKSKPYALRKLNELISWGILQSSSSSKNDPNNSYIPHKNLSAKEEKLSTNPHKEQSTLF